ncbi:MAG: hypothetical protein PHS44_00830 [Candidatus Dojkabacteria bacterium]|nr:hypothetical protein [Candidatus Dojkabacteria bacterium]
MEQHFYEMATESPQVIKRIARRIRPPPNIIVTVVGGEPWPNLFANIWPEATIISFDVNRRQISEFESQIVEVTGSRPLLVDVTSPQFDRLLEEHNPEFVFLSNIPDYLTIEELIELANILADYGVRTILFSQIDDPMKIEHYEEGAVDVFLTAFQDEGYDIATIRTQDPYDINTFYLLTIEDDSEALE